ncbi:MAG: ribosome biogenesis GTPase Der [Ignavibacteriae bacterium HGW-Ignavibacteriae-2]|jgi:GTP-binding protein|nr:MAG: ribosome biogenesis GTPase Der [Ignavibacteriae bacterium HGW-Ignavibacteriae-2]
MKIPLVVILGRPNVGKSTLFNRLTKSKLAIVDDVSGVTRDRIYGEVEWNGKIFRIMDTGGYVPDSDDLFEIAIKEQVKIAIEEADAILFVTDGRAGVLPVDADIANMLRLSDKPSFILVNKSDNDTQSLNKNDFYSLGIDHVYDIAAISGRNVGDLLDTLVNSINFPDDYLDEDVRLKISVIGRPNVGKSSLTNALLGSDRSIVTDIPGTTRDSINSTLKYYGEEIILVDTAGLRKKAKVQENIEFYSNVRTFRAIADCDVAVILLDSRFGLENQDQKIIDEAVRRRKGIILAVNKWDLVEKQTNTAKQFEDSIRFDLGTVDYLPIIFISALSKQRIFKIIDLAKSIREERKKKIPTSVLNETLLPEIAITPPPSTSRGKEIKIKYITQVGEKYPIFLIFANDPNSISDSYRRFVEKLIRRHFGFFGVPITVSFKDKNPIEE